MKLIHTNISLFSVCYIYSTFFVILVFKLKVIIHYAFYYYTYIRTYIPGSLLRIWDFLWVEFEISQVQNRVHLKRAILLSRNGCFDHFISLLCPSLIWKGPMPSNRLLRGYTTHDYSNNPGPNHLIASESCLINILLNFCNFFKDSSL